MSDKNNDEYLDLADFNKKYEHYADDSIESEKQKEILEFEDISSYSEGNADFYMKPREEGSGDVYIGKNSAPVNDINEADENMNSSKSKKRKTKENKHDENYSEDGKRTKKKKGNFFTRNHCRNIKIIALLLVIAILLVLGGGLAYLYIATGKGSYGDDGLDYNDPATEQIIYEEDHNWTAMGDVDANSLNDFLYKWANNGGEKMYSKNVINVLLCGVDSETGKSDAGRSDIMMLVSINKKTKTITLVSLLRDSWTYMSLPRSDGSYYDHYFKLNSAYSYGGPTTLLNTIENNYKIEIDQFIAVDFVSFPKLIDALGGVTVDVQEYEANYIRRTSSHKRFPYGTATLNGDQALIYSRIRKCDADSDISRTRRQRSIIKALIDSAKSATNGQLLNAFKLVSPYIRTGYTQSEVFALIAQAYTNGWMNYKMVEVVLPNEDYVDRASTKINGQWAWVADYASCAQKLQRALYGETNIVLDPNRTTALDLISNLNSGGSSGNSGNSGSSGGSNSSTSGGNGYTDEDESTQLTEPSSSGVTDPSYTLPTLPTLPSIQFPTLPTGSDEDETRTQPSSDDDSQNND